MKSRNMILVLLALLTAGSGGAIAAALDVTSQGNPFMTNTNFISDTDYFTRWPGDNVFPNLTDGNNDTTADTYSGLAFYDSVGLQFPEGITGIQRIEWDLQVFVDGGWFDTADVPIFVQVTTEQSFGSVDLIPGSVPGFDQIWQTVPWTHNYPAGVKGAENISPGVPADGTTFTFELDFAEKIYGIRIIGDPGGTIGNDINGFLGAEEIRVFQDDSMIRATAVTPDEGQTGVAVASAVLQWTPAQENGVTDPNVVGHYVYVGTDPNGLLVSGEMALPVGTTSFVPTLATDTDYYWHVDELLDDGTVLKGYTYSFQTELSVPIITAQPANQLVKKGEDAAFSVAATNPLISTMTYQWYYDADGVAGGGVPLQGGAYSGVDSAELNVFAVDVSDEGYYYCEVNNGYSKLTRMAKLDVARQLYHWPLDGDGIEANGSGYDGVLMGGAQFVLQGSEPSDVSVVGSGALKLDGIDDFLNIAGDVPMPGAGDVPGFTVSCWVNSPDLSRTLQGMVGKFGSDDGSQNDDNFILATAVPAYGKTNGVWVQHSYGTWYTWVFASEVLEENEWAFVTFACSAYRDFDIYINGEIVVNYDAHNTSYEDLPGDIRIGHAPAAVNDLTSPEHFFKGRIDDVKIYNYSMRPAEVAELYTDEVGGAICLGNPQFDLDQSCKVDLGDIVMLAGEWLECGMYPDCY